MDHSLEQAIVVVPAELSPPEASAVAMLVEEVEKRAQIRWTVTQVWPSASVPVIGVGTGLALAETAGPHAAGLAADAATEGPEGFRIRLRSSPPAPVVFVVGNDPRGVLFGVGRLLRSLRMRRGQIRLPARLDIATAPCYPLRGHQLGYRPKTNSYDGWTLAMWEQHIRDLVVFGANAIELIPPRSDDDADSPHFPLPPMPTMIGMSRIAAAYGLDVWIWYPAMEPEYDEATLALAETEWDEVFRQLPRVDAVFVPGGDPGHTAPEPLMRLLERQAAVLRRSHPQAQMWVSPQGFDREWLDRFLEILTREQPAWLTGVVYGPQIRVSLAELRAALPERYPIRHYPDITHSRQCQFPVPNWDVAYALTLGRECINPRPRGQTQIFRRLQDTTIGFITYSEGCNDDVNKAIWSALGWDPDADVREILCEYARYFIGDEHADPFASCLLALERNWEGALLANEGVTTTLQQLQSLEQSGSPQLLLNWRFQQALYRGYYDAYTRRRLLYETELEEQAMEALRQAERIGALRAMAHAEAILDRAETEPVASDWRARIFELGEALFQSIRMQLSVPRYQAIAVGRGANLDTLDLPLNNAPWLRRQFAEIRDRASEKERQTGIHTILHWTDPGPAGFYDDLGDLGAPSHLVSGPGFPEDPDHRESALIGFSAAADGRISWRRHAESLYDAPLRLRYVGLDPEARYRVRVVYGSDAMRRKVRLVAGTDHEVHPYIPKPAPIEPMEFDVPQEAIEGRELVLAWCGEPGLGGNGRGCQVAEVWLLRV